MPAPPSPPHLGAVPERAIAQLAREVGNALIRFASSLDAARPADDPYAGLGQRQRDILALPGLRTRDGLTTKQIADAIEYRAPSTTHALHRLVELGHLEQVSGVRPAHWRRTSPA